jgi:hypothetical protein
MELTRELEKMRLSPVGANAPWLFILGTVAEFVSGVAFISASIRVTAIAVTEDRLLWVGPVLLLMGILLLAQVGYLTFKRSVNRRLQALYHALLESTSTPEG